jgi:DNA repair protein RadC
MYQLSTGSISGTMVDIRLVFTAALKANAVNILLAHNNPSGSLKPSRQDELLTQKFKTAGEMLDIKILDHLIVCKEDYYSFADEGLI